MNSTYFWTPLESTDFSLGVVVPVGYRKDELATLQIPEGNTKNTNDDNDDDDDDNRDDDDDDHPLRIITQGEFFFRLQV